MSFCTCLAVLDWLHEGSEACGYYCVVVLVVDESVGSEEVVEEMRWTCWCKWESGVGG